MQSLLEGARDCASAAIQGLSKVVDSQAASVLAGLPDLVVATRGIWQAAFAGPQAASIPVTVTKFDPSTPYLLYRDAKWELTLVGGERGADGVRLAVTYRNTSSTAETLVCPTATGGHLTLESGVIVPMTDSICASQVGGQFAVPGGGTFNSWGEFPIPPGPAQHFSLTWWNWGTTPNDIPLAAS